MRKELPLLLCLLFCTGCADKIVEGVFRSMIHRVFETKDERRVRKDTVRKCEDKPLKYHRNAEDLKLHRENLRFHPLTPGRSASDKKRETKEEHDVREDMVRYHNNEPLKHHRSVRQLKGHKDTLMFQQWQAGITAMELDDSRALKKTHGRSATRRRRATEKNVLGVDDKEGDRLYEEWRRIHMPVESLETIDTE